MLIDSANSEVLRDSSATSSKLIALASALLVATLLLGGYFYLRNRHARQTATAVAEKKTSATSSAPKGPAKLQVFLDEPTLKAGESVIGGIVRNISNEPLNGLAVELELWRRGDGGTEQKTVALEPANLAPNQDGRYTMKLRAQDYSNVRFIGIRNDAGLLAYSSAEGQKRPLEKTEPKTVVIPKPVGRGDEFINTPDNPGRVP
jgi:hypothetical protein